MADEAGLERAFVEATEVARYFWDWRYKLLTYSLTLNTALFAAATWTYAHASATHRWLSLAPLFGGLLTSMLLAVMDYRNSLLLDIAYSVAAPIESRWLSQLGTAQPPGFYASIQRNVGKSRTFRSAWKPTDSSYTIVLRWWFTTTAVAYAAAFCVDAVNVHRAYATTLVGACVLVAVLGTLRSRGIARPG